MAVVLMKSLCYLMVVVVPLTRLIGVIDNRYALTSKFFGPEVNFIMKMKSAPTTIELCSAPEDIMFVNNIHLNPDPPQKGANLSVIINGVLHQDINDGAYMLAHMKKGPIKFPQIKFPLCDYISSGCPVQKGQASLELVFEIPKMIPGGVYEVSVLVFNNDRSLQSLLNGDFHIPGTKRIMKSITGSDETTVTGDRIACAKGSIEL